MLVTYMGNLITCLEDKKQGHLTFAVLCDEWADGNTHNNGVFATFPDGTTLGYERVLLCISLIDNRDCMDAEEHFHFLKIVLSVTNQTMDNVVELVGDDSSTNCAFDRRVCPIFVAAIAIAKTWPSRTSSNSIRNLLRE